MVSQVHLHRQHCGSEKVKKIINVKNVKNLEKVFKTFNQKSVYYSMSY